MTHTFLFRLAAAVLAAAGCAGSAAELLYDFEAPTSLNGWSALASRSAELPVEGDWSLLFQTPAWLPEEHNGQSVWPNCETEQLPFGDWSKYDRIVFDFFNDSKTDMLAGVFIADSKRNLLESMGGEYTIPPFSRFQCVMPFNLERIDLKDVHRLHFFTENPASDFRLFIDSIRLLEPGEAVPEAPPAYLAACRERREKQLAPEREARLAALAAFDPSRLPGRFAAAWQARRDEYVAFLTQDHPVEDGLIVTDLLGTSTRFASLVSQYHAFAAADKDDVVVGWATPMDKVLPYLPIYRPLPETLSLRAARGEKESLQLLVQPIQTALQAANVSVSALSGPAGTIPSTSFSVCPVGYVKTTQSPAYPCDYVGWWPDPLLPYLGAVAVEPGTAQSFWVRLTVPEDQAAGTYSGTVTVSSAAGVLREIPLTVQVYDFAVPKKTPLDLAVTFAPEEWYPDWKEWHQFPDRPKDAWSKHRLRYTEMLADYYLGYDSLYEYGDWDFNMVAHLQRQGRFNRLNLGYFPPYEGDGANMRKVIETIRPRYEYAKKLGILDGCYIYGCDEIFGSRLPDVEKSAAMLKEAFPEVEIMVSAMDYTFGKSGVLQHVDTFVPLTPPYSYNLAQIEAARKAGKKIWWYICAGPVRAYGNAFIERSGIELRLLMGAMAQKFQTDGFLYYQVSCWAKNRYPISGGPFTAWNPEIVGNFHGDGTWLYPGPDGIPLPSIRLECFRDGLEDYAYMDVLRREVARVRPQPNADAAWLAAAEATLAVPDDLVHSLRSFSREPERLRQWRDRVAELIEKAPRP